MQDEGSADGPAGAPRRRRIAVMRHGKAEPSGRTDFEREIAERGRHDSADTGSWLAEQGFVPDLALVSAAHRTVGTWRSVAAAGGYDLEPRLSQVLYGAGPETALDLLRESAAEASAILVVGHNPTMAYLASLLDNGEGDPEVASEMMSGYPTSAVALFAYEGQWRDLDEASATLVGYYVGRG
ncbi:SixA phosphatase family protein [Nocardioides agariphilus]